MGRVVVVGSVQQRVVVDVLRIPLRVRPPPRCEPDGASAGAGAPGGRRPETGADVAMVAAIGDDDGGRCCGNGSSGPGIAPRGCRCRAESTGQAIVAREDGDATP